MKICTRCNIEKSLSEFSKDKHKNDGLSCWCKECRKEYYQDHIEEIKEYYQNNKEKISEQYQTLDGRYFLYRRNATRKSREFVLTVEQFEEVTSQFCYYCGKYTEGKEHCGIDRVDNDKGYILENCVPCCFRCNSWKGKLTMKEFWDHIQSIWLHFAGA